ncbi:MAG: DUF3352 domain-containing protein [bacterium]|nr:DUF3352 domain-containing protein [bacterium]
MRKFMLLVLLVALLGMVGVGRAAALPVDELTTLAAYAPAETQLFAVIRTDEAYLDTLDALLARLSAALPGAIPEDATVRDVFTDDTIDSFEEDVRPWLGDTVAAAFPLGLGTFEPLYFLSVTDRDAADAFLEAELSDGEAIVERTEQEDGTVRFDVRFGSNPPFTSALLTDDVALIGEPEALETVILPGDDVASLADDGAFQDTLAALPADDYNALLYVTGEGVEAALDLPEEAAEPFGLDNLADQIGSLAVGLTVLEDRALTVDVVTAGGDLNALIGLGSTPLDLDDLAARIPTDTPLVILGNNLGGHISGGLQLLEALSPLVQANNMGFSNQPMTERPTLADLVTFIRLAYQGVIGQPLDDALASANGDFALTLDFDVAEAGDQFGLLIEPGFLLRTDNAGDSALLVSAIARLVTQSFPRATFSDGVLTIPQDFLFRESDGLPLIAEGQLVSSDEFVAAGTTANVQFGLSPDGDALPDSDIYAFERGLFVESPQTVWLVNVAALRDLYTEVNEAVPGLLDSIDTNLAQIEGLLNLIDSAAISAAATDDGVLARFTLTLSAE